MMQNKHIMVSAASGLLVGLFLGFLFRGGVATTLPGNDTAPEDGALLAENATLREKLREAYGIEEEQFFLAGTIESISDDTVMLRVEHTETEALLYPDAPEIYEVVVTDDTTLIRRSDKNPAEYEAELNAYQQRVAELQDAGDFTAADSLESPLVNEEEPIRLRDLSAGQQIQVSTTEDVRTAAVIVASEIVLDETLI